MNLKAVPMVLTCAFMILVMVGSVGCSSDDASGPSWENLEKTRENITREIDDKQRAEQLLALVDAHEIKVVAIGDEVQLIRQELERKNADYTTSRAELEALYGQLETKVDLVLITIRDDSMKMKSMCSEDEWEGIFAHRKQRFKIFK